MHDMARKLQRNKDAGASLAMGASKDSLYTIQDGGAPSHRIAASSGQVGVGCSGGVDGLWAVRLVEQQRLMGWGGRLCRSASVSAALCLSCPAGTHPAVFSLCACRCCCRHTTGTASRHTAATLARRRGKQRGQGLPAGGPAAAAATHPGSHQDHSVSQLYSAEQASNVARRR
jgi:hypothetical protein